MRRNSTSTMGAFHPILFFIFIYGISVLMALFVCRTVYISVNGDPDEIAQNEINKANSTSFAASNTTAQATALR